MKVMEVLLLAAMLPNRIQPRVAERWSAFWRRPRCRGRPGSYGWLGYLTAGGHWKWRSRTGVRVSGPPAQARSGALSPPLRRIATHADPNQTGALNPDGRPGGASRRATVPVRNLPPEYRGETDGQEGKGRRLPGLPTTPVTAAAWRRAWRRRLRTASATRAPVSRAPVGETVRLCCV